VFLDTNVLVFSTQSLTTRHLLARDRLLGLERDGGEAFISRQVLREYLAAVTRPQGVVLPMPMDLAILRVRQFASAYSMLEDNGEVMRHLHDLLRRFPVGGAQIHDANIVATMLAHGVRRLLTDNVADFARFSSVIEVVPLDD
jgi:predicted nucleic acid-binding protein